MLIESNVIVFNSAFLKGKSIVTSHVFPLKGCKEQSRNHPKLVMTALPRHIDAAVLQGDEAGSALELRQFAELCHFNLASKHPYVFFSVEFPITPEICPSANTEGAQQCHQALPGKWCQCSAILEKCRHGTAVY